ncbi:MAG TPA: DinB family protein [Thermomicrobiales bacterium]|nr:DinB family protein [Thermomicrobiales bacterium]
MVLHPVSASRVSSETIREIRATVFRRRESTLADEASRFSVVDLEVTLLSMRRDIRLLLETLPGAAFTAQPANDDPVWSAGEIVAHLRHAQMNIFLRATRAAAGLAAGRDAERPDDDGVHPVRSRAASLAILDDADRDLIEVFDSLPDAVDLERTVIDDKLGPTGVRDSLLFLAIHDDDHLGQLRELAREGS